MKGLLLIRADADPEIGAGHVMRCLALAQGWQDRGGRALLATAAPHPAIAGRLETEGIAVHPLPGAPGSAEDAESTARLAHEARASWTVVDGYRFDASYRQRLRDAGLRVLWIDDEGQPGPCAADLVLNQNLHAAHDLYPGREATARLLLGGRYVLLRREFRRWRTWRRETPDAASQVLVTAGGADPSGLARLAVEALRRTELRAIVVTGHLAADEAALQAAAVGGERILFRRQVDDMPQLMAKADLALAAAGSTAWELAFMGLPALLAVTAPNQRPVAAELAARGAAVNLGEAEDLDSDRIAAELRRLAADREARASAADAGRRWVDGRGVERVLAAMSADLRLRRVAADDRRLLWEWANDPEVRAAAFSSAAIPWDDHVRWFEAKLRSPDCRHYLALDGNGDPVGQVRFDAIGPGEAEISVSIGRRHRGSGYGQPLLELAVDRIFEETSLVTLHAYIKLHNAASVRAFEQADFEPCGETTVQGHRVHHYVRRRDAEPREAP